METIDVKDVDAAKTARGEILSVAAVYRLATDCRSAAGGNSQSPRAEMAEAQNVEVVNCGDGSFDITFSFRCECGAVHEGHEVARRPVRFVEYVRNCGGTNIVFDYKDAKFFDVGPGLPN